MPYRPKQVHWFEAELPRDQSVLALETLVSTGSVQLEEEGVHASPCVNIEVLKKHLSKCDQLIQRYADDLPVEELRPVKHLGDPLEVARSAINTIHHWIDKLLDTKRRLRITDIETGELILLGECITAMGEDAQGIGGFGHSTKQLYKQIFACPKGKIDEIAGHKDVFDMIYRGNSRDFLIIVGMPDKKRVFDSASALFECTPLVIPDWLPGLTEEQAAAVEVQKQRLHMQKISLTESLQSLRRDTAVIEALSNIRLLRWYQKAFFSQSGDQSKCHLNGWTIASSPDMLEAQLASAGISAKIAFTPPRAQLKPPVSLDAGRWSGPFQLFIKLLGTPGSKEIDPTRLLALVVPLLFGFMFPDVGHGLILAAAGYLMAKRNNAALILVPCGLSAAGFGFLFGEFFGLHGLLPSILGYPLEQPVEILVVPMVFGIALMLLGLLFSGIEAWWRFEFGRWMLEEASVILLYLSTTLLLLFPVLWPITVLGLVWYFVGVGILCRRSSSGCVIQRIGRLVESGFQLFVGTISFLRVGAFALAHCAFSNIVLILAEQVETVVLQAVIFVAGHTFIIVVEGLIVMIQTARLILFEFFMRFLHFDGRIYKPLDRLGSD